MKDWSEEDAEDSEEDSDSDGGGQSSHSSQPTFVHVKPVSLALHQVGELCIQPLTIKIVNRILKRILVSLLAHALVSSSLESSSLNWHTLQRKELMTFKTVPVQATHIGSLVITFVRSLESIWSVIFSWTLIDVQLLNIHGHCHSSPGGKAING